MRQRVVSRFDLSDEEIADLPNLHHILLAVDSKQKLILLNAGVAGGLVVSYFRGAPIWIVAICGVFLFVLVNVLALIKIRKSGFERARL